MPTPIEDTEVLSQRTLRKASQLQSQPRAAAPTKKLSVLLFVCGLLACVLVAAVAALLVIDPDGPAGRNWLIALAAAATLAGVATIAAALRDYHEARMRETERRTRELIFYESDTLRTEIADLRGLIVELLGPLPSAVTAFGDQREDEGEDRARRWLDQAATAMPGIDKVTVLSEVRKRGGAPNGAPKPSTGA